MVAILWTIVCLFPWSHLWAFTKLIQQELKSFWITLYNCNVTEGAVLASLAFAFIISFFGILLGVILLKGTNQVSIWQDHWMKHFIKLHFVLQKRVSYIKAWIIYAITAIVVSIIGVILNSSGSYGSTTGTAVVSGILGIAINLFSVIVVYIHMKEINEGVFIP